MRLPESMGSSQELPRRKKSRTRLELGDLGVALRSALHIHIYKLFRLIVFRVRQPGDSAST